MKRLPALLICLLLLGACAAQPASTQPDTPQEPQTPSISTPMTESSPPEEPGNSEQADKSEEPSKEMQTADPWGLTLETTEVTPQGLTLRFTQSGGEADGELSTGSPFMLEELVEGEWQPVPTLISDLAWDAIAYLIDDEAETLHRVNWEILYGALPAGEYRITKTVHNLRAPGDYDERVYTATFTLSEN